MTYYVLKVTPTNVRSSHALKWTCLYCRSSCVHCLLQFASTRLSIRVVRCVTRSRLVVKIACCRMVTRGPIYYVVISFQTTQMSVFDHELPAALVCPSLSYKHW